MTIEELKQALDAATPGPLFTEWSEVSEALEITCEARKGVVGIAQIETGFSEDFDAEQKANARLIVEAVNNLPKLLKVAEAARTMLDGGMACEDFQRDFICEREDIDALCKTLEELSDD